jgi:DNA-binding CsgD family transcriptional regulator
MKKSTLKIIKENWPQLVQENDAKQFPLTIDLRSDLLSLLHTGESFYLIHHIPSGKIEYLSPTGYKMLGVKKSDLTAKEFLSYFHPEDVTFFINCKETFFEFLSKLPIDKIKNYKGQKKFRIRKNNGEFLEFLEQGTILQTNKKGDFIRALLTFTDISHLKTDNTQTFSIIGLNGEPSYLNIPITQSTIPKSKDLLTNREKTILSHLINGSTSNNIAETLNISTHTVNTHRKNILYKTNCKSTTELILKSMEMGWS